MRISKNKLIALIVENLALLGIGVILVIGFWYHEYFYSVYAPILFIAGGAVIVVMIWTIVWIRKDRDFFNKAKGVIIFEPKEKELVEKGEKTALIFKDHLDTYHKNEVYKAKINITSKKDFAKLALKKIFHIELDDLSKMDITKLGFEDTEEFKDYWKKRYGKYKKKQEATLITFNLVEGK
jgi:hypothetical protein